jgi:hypothetical protein
MPIHWMRALESTGFAGRIRCCGRRSSWACDAASASMAAANRANRGPRGPPSVGRLRLLVGGRDRRVGSKLRGAGHALHAAPLAPRIAPTVLGPSATRAPDTFWRLIRLSHHGSSWRYRDQRKLRVEPLPDVRGASCRTCRPPLRVNATELFCLQTGSFGQNQSSCKNFLALDLLQIRAVFIRYLIICLSFEPLEEKRATALPVRRRVEPLLRVPRPWRRPSTWPR